MTTSSHFPTVVSNRSPSPNPNNHLRKRSACVDHMIAENKDMMGELDPLLSQDAGGDSLATEPSSPVTGRRDTDQSDRRTADQADSPAPCISVHPPSSPYSHSAVEALRYRLRFFFMNPVEKWRIRRQIPWKLLMQVIKIILVTSQVSLFGNDRYAHVNFYWGTTISVSHLFLEDWDTSREIVSYPPSDGPYSVYTKSDFYDSINYAVTRYGNIRDLSVASLDYTMLNGDRAPATMCRTFYRTAEVWGHNQSYVFDGIIDTACLRIPTNQTMAQNESFWDTFNSEEYFNQNNFSFNFDRLIKAQLTFPLSTVHLQGLSTLETPNCFLIDVIITYDNNDHDGQIQVSAEIDPVLLRCRGDVQWKDNRYSYRAFIVLLNVSVILTCLVSFVLCCRAVIKAQLLRAECVTFFKKHFGKQLTTSDQMEFINLWYLMILVNDVLIILGSAIKIQIENKMIEGDLYNLCGVLLGIGTLLVWVGVLRYLGFFPKYNILILTLRGALLDVFRFLLCAILVYAGFVFCGWVVLGPYHMKFRTLSTTSECLFALINGDDMFATFNILGGRSSLLWWFSRFYIYIFISLFIYVVLSLFIALIMDAYETIMMFYQHGFPTTDLTEFMAETECDVQAQRTMPPATDASNNNANVNGDPPSGTSINAFYRLVGRCCRNRRRRVHCTLHIQKQNQRRYGTIP